MKYALLIFVIIIGTQQKSYSQNPQSTDVSAQPYYLYDRGTGMSTSFPGIYLNKNQFVVYPFFEYYLFNKQDYMPSTFGYDSQDEFLGKFRQSEELIFLSYGITKWLAFELEASPAVQAHLFKSPDDHSGMPSEYTESGLGDIQNQFDITWKKETAKCPEIFSTLEIDYPFQKDRLLIGTQFWEFQFGAGLIKGFSFGTLKTRASLSYTTEENSVVFGEFAVEYLKKLSDKWKVYGGIEGDGSELELITELEYYFNQHIFLKVNNAFGLNNQTAEWAPETGVVFLLH